MTILLNPSWSQGLGGLLHPTRHDAHTGPDLNMGHKSDVIMSAMASQITGFTNVYTPFVQAQIIENIKAPRHRPLWGEFTGDRWIPHTKGQ